MSSLKPVEGGAGHSTPDVRMLTTIAWIVGPTVIFVGWFLMSVIAGSQQPGGAKDGTSLALVFLFALITSVPLIIVSLIGGVTTMLSSTLRSQRTLSLLALIWSAIVFAIYFGLFGIVGSLPDDGFPVNSKTIAALIPIALITIALPIVLYIVARRRIKDAPAVAGVPATAPSEATPYVYDI